MWENLLLFFNSKGFRLFLRVLASVASAIVVVSGFLFWQNQRSRQQQATRPLEAPPKGEEEPEDQEQPNPKVRFLHRR
ncbi:MAG: hypothetical protein A2600_08540 [Candidatus Lambdaproteobacteria bacterium RIFOXYD1_FULL_56_27]|uniref:Uncharacterized protein n=1 Tax=Candidatus Lambdaproteobacteria bacterium RIFOXYD2_FULL_56_26 TaxID=1817773 RepID=A0A1F6GMA3_9PROT|nr:MAG: hypothetical protein A2557_10280 [Candidatus Lambdaproteobacteria bacterium RIFOXYD2_FULL_56_26]OGH01791.1 MAG: hypothetical protein A2426_14195 [Candidatus Lambdaproteobacteria bacterium RIFOXYC1_FULL_56_13]OGH07941.1 MAG: hypothetical protein A2600_08540 [Candidatus Lambdaproteobacteria bacterium RIFOXYD1_FULL_56_27]